jgi:hypothetical protein
MRFTLSHERVVIGHRISVKVVAGSNEVIARVTTKLDGRELGDDRLKPEEVQYERSFEQQGGAGPGQDHVLMVSATDGDGKIRTASQRWTDSM